MAKTQEHVKLFAELGKTFQPSEELVNNLQEFVCKINGKEIADIDLLRYKLYCSKKGKCEIERLPPCMAALRQHCLRANYQTCGFHQLTTVGCLMKMDSLELTGWTVSQHQMRYAFMILFSSIFFALLIFSSWVLQIVS